VSMSERLGAWAAERAWVVVRVALCALAICGCLTFSAGRAAATGLPGSIEEFPLLLEGWASFDQLAAGPEGNIWLIENVDHDGRLGWFWRISPSGVVTGEFRIPTSEASGPNPDLPFMTFPTDLARGPDGNMWFTDEGVSSEGLNLIGQVTPAGVVKEFPIPSAALPFPEFLGGPVAIAGGAEGNVWFTDNREDESGHSFIGSVTPSGVITEFSVPTGSQANLPTSSMPAGIALGTDGNMWFADQGTNSEGQNLIGRITPSGTITEFPIPKLGADPRAVAAGADGNVWFTEAGVDRIGRITSAGQITEFEVPSVGEDLKGLALGADGNIWFTGNYLRPNIEWIAPDGSVRELPAALVGSALPVAIVAGPDGNLWFTDGRFSGGGEGGFGPYGYIGRLVVPFVPANTEPPSISGRPVEGGRLLVSEGSWTHDPATFSYQWQRCDASGLNCEDLPGDVEAAYVVGAADVGHVLRAVVTAANVAGSASAVSGASALVSGLPATPVPPPPRPLPAQRLQAVLDATMVWAFRQSHGYTTVKSLAVDGMPVGGFVEILCKGTGCPFSHRRIAAKASRHVCRAHRCAKHSASLGGELNLTDLFHARRLRPGVRLTVSVVKEGWIGKSFVFAVRKNQLPSSSVTCLQSGSVSLSHVC
jgi:streptogramin lyase